MQSILVILSILEIIVAFVKSETGNGPKMAKGEAWLRIAGAAAGGYQAEVGQPLDPEKIRPYTPMA